MDFDARDHSRGPLFGEAGEPDPPPFPGPPPAINDNYDANSAVRSKTPRGFAELPLR